MSSQSGIPTETLAAPLRRWSTRRLVLTGILVCLCLGGLFVASMLYFIESMMRSSGAYQLALDTAAQSTCVRNTIGMPLKPGWFTTGNIDLHNSDGEAHLGIPVNGPSGKGDIDVEATKTDGQWRITSLDFEGRDGRIQLIPALSGSACTIVNPAYK